MAVTSCLLGAGEFHRHLLFTPFLHNYRFGTTRGVLWDECFVLPRPLVRVYVVARAFADNLVLEGQNGLQQWRVVLPLASHDQTEVLRTVEVAMEAADLLHVETAKIRNVTSGVRGVE